MNGLLVRWSLRETPAAVVDELVSYVARTEHAAFTGRSGLRFATWRMVPGEWFEVAFVFVDDAARADVEARYAGPADQVPVSRLLGRAPELVQACEVLAVAEGWDGFVASARA